MAEGKRQKRAAEFIEPFRVKPGSKVSLATDFDPAFKAGVKKKEGVALLQEGVRLLSEYQARPAAQDSGRVLVVLQALDAVGKDGTIRHLMSGVNPRGWRCTASSSRRRSSIGLSAFALMLIVSAYECRSVAGSVLVSEAFDKARMSWTAVVELALAVTITQMDLVNRLLGTTPLTAPRFGLSLASAVLLLVPWEIGKLIAGRS